jgi:hypothetical protein
MEQRWSGAIESLLKMLGRAVDENTAKTEAMAVTLRAHERAIDETREKLAAAEKRLAAIEAKLAGPGL